MSEQIVSVPYSPATEDALIASILIDPECIRTLTVNPEDLYLTKNQRIYTVFQEISREGGAPDYVTVGNRLQAHGWLAEIGGPAELMRIGAINASALFADQYQTIVLDLARRRRIISAAQRLAVSAYDLDSNLDDTVSKTMDALSRTVVKKKGARHISEFVSSVYDQTSAAQEHPGDIYGIPTGFRDWDAWTGGLQRGEVFKLSGEPGLGKSLLAAQVLANAAEAGHPGALYELEMDCQNVVRRILSGKTKIATKAMRTGRMTDADWPTFTSAVEKLSELPVYMSDESQMSTADIRADLHRLQDQFGVELVVIDYEALLSDSGGADETENSQIKSSRVHGIMKDLNLAGIVIDDMTKAGINGMGGKTGLAGSARKLHDADQIAIMRKREGGGGTVRLQWEKNREGNPDIFVDLVKLPNYPVFADSARRVP